MTAIPARSVHRPIVSPRRWRSYMSPDVSSRHMLGHVRYVRRYPRDLYPEVVDAPDAAAAAMSPVRAKPQGGYGVSE